MDNQFYKTSTLDNLTMQNKTGYNSTFAIGGASCSADSLEVAESFVQRIFSWDKRPPIAPPKTFI